MNCPDRRVFRRLSPTRIPRRHFIKSLSLGTMAAAAGGATFPLRAADAVAEYRGPNVILVRFGGGVRRHETIDAQHTYAPYFCHELIPRGTLFPKMEIDSFSEIETSHGQGTLYLLTGKYDKYKDVGGRFLGQRFEPKVPTLFEYFRKTFKVAPHEALIVNGEDRKDEEFYNFSNHTLYGVDFRSTTLSLHRFKSFVLRRQLASGEIPEAERDKRLRELRKMESLDERMRGSSGEGQIIESFWERWREHYGESALVNPRGDRLLTELTVRAMKELRPRLTMVNYNDPDYVHWGNPTHYTRGIAIIDEGLKQLVQTVEADPHYRDNTVFVVVPDCGRDSNPFAPVPFQHHFNSHSAREVFALVFGPGIDKGAVVDRRVEHISVAATLGRLMKFPTPFAEGPVLTECWA